MKHAFLLVLASIITLSSSLAATVPVRWLQGPQGYKQALALQKETNLPILVWTTWHECPYCGQVTTYLAKPQPKKALQPYIRIVIDEHGNRAEAALAAEKDYKGGNFYIIAPSDPTKKDSLWAWKLDGGRVILPDLDAQLVAKLTAAK